MNEADIRTIVEELFLKRPVFHSEDDFKHEVAFKLRDRGFNKTRLEKSFKINNSPKMELDIYLETDKEKIGIELKYKTKSQKLEWDGELFNLTSHAAHNLGGYDFIKDIYRLRKMIEAKIINKGYAIFYTNDKTYYPSNKKEGKFGKGFFLTEGREIKKGEKVCFPKDANPKSIQNRTSSIIFENDYKFKWSEISIKNGNTVFEKFKYLLVEV